MTNPKSNEGLDITKIYIFAIGALTIGSLGWLLYNYILGSQYQRAFRQGAADLKNVLELEKGLPPKPAQMGPPTIENVFEFFKRTVRGLQDVPEVEDPPVQTENIGGVLVEEKHYLVRFEKGVSRAELARYIFKIQEAKPFLKVKSLDLQRVENIPAYQENGGWKAQIQFAFRRPKAGG
jgi:hypothetical protein